MKKIIIVILISIFGVLSVEAQVTYNRADKLKGEIYDKVKSKNAKGKKFYFLQGPQDETSGPFPPRF